jgi:N-acylneuraminate cytidylyltransferase
MTKQRVVALVPLRGGSKGIPDKNIKMMAGKPLCAWVLEALAACSCVDDVYVSTDSRRIADVVDSLGLGTMLIFRPDKLATDTATTESVMLHFEKCVSFDVLITAQATSPLTKASDFDNAVRFFREENLDSLVTGVRTKRFIWSDLGIALNYDYRFRPRRQDFPGSFVENGAFYITKREILETYKCRLGGAMDVYEMPKETEIEIDDYDDWDVVERLLLESKGGG